MKFLIAILLGLSAALSQGALHYSDYEDRVIPTDSLGVYINPVAGAFTSSTPADYNTSPWINLFFGGTAIGNSSAIMLAITGPATGNGDGLVMKIDGSEEIGPTLDFTVGANGSENHTGTVPGRFRSGEAAYLGFSIPALGGMVSYGWVFITVGETGTGVVHSAAWEDTPELAIVAGSVPELRVSLLMLIAATVLGTIRRR